MYVYRYRVVFCWIRSCGLSFFLLSRTEQRDALESTKTQLQEELAEDQGRIAQLENDLSKTLKEEELELLEDTLYDPE